MSNYLILIFQDEAAAQPSGDSVSANYRAFMEKHAGSLRGGVALENPATATSIRRDEAGESVVTDGPFAESKEALGGTFLIEAADLDEALAIAKEVPAGIGVEVRPGAGRDADDGGRPCGRRTRARAGAPRVGLRAGGHHPRRRRHRLGRGGRAGRLRSALATWPPAASPTTRRRG